MHNAIIGCQWARVTLCCGCTAPRARREPARFREDAQDGAAAPLETSSAAAVDRSGRYTYVFGRNCNLASMLKRCPNMPTPAASHIECLQAFDGRHDRTG